MASADRLLRAPPSETAAAAELQSACRELLPPTGMPCASPSAGRCSHARASSAARSSGPGSPAPRPPSASTSWRSPSCCTPPRMPAASSSPASCGRPTCSARSGSPVAAASFTRAWPRVGGSRSRLGLVPAFAPASLSHAAYTLATLYANAAYKRHLAARGERAAGGAADRGHRRAGAPRTPGPLVGRGAVRLGSAHQALSAPAYWSEPGVVSFSPVSSSVFRPESTIGQPP
jgi:hypothetical protein